MRSLLIYNENAEERERLSSLLKSGDFTVFETSRFLEAVHMLKNNDVGIVVAPQGLNGVEAPEFREIVEKTRPGVSILFLGAGDENALSIDPGEFRQFIQSALKTEIELEHEVRDLKQFFFDFTDRLLQIFEANNRYFFNNDHLVAELSAKIASRMSLDPDMIDTIRMAALLRDIGKVGIQQQILEDKKKLTRDELVPIRNHPLNSVLILKQIKFPWNVDSIIAQHHERYDGRGYPLGLKGRQIPIGARIISIADSYYAMTADRPYRKALQREEAVKEIVKQAGSQFDPEVTEVFLQVMAEEGAEKSGRKSILIIERQPTVAALIRLSVDASQTGISQAANSFDALRLARQQAPHLVVADVEILDKDAFFQFYNVAQEIPALKDRPFIFVVPDKNYPRHFKGRKVEYISKPINIAELTEKITAMLEYAPVPQAMPEEAKGVTGSLTDFSLTDIVQILNLGLKTAKVEITGAGGAGRVFLVGGRIVSAELADMRGNDAFFEMVKWEVGTFQILHGVPPPEENITMDTMHLLLEASRAIDEAARAKQA